jgi:hypothetical protein
VTYWVLIAISGDRLSARILNVPAVQLGGATVDSLAAGAGRALASHFVATDRRGEPRPIARSMAELLEDPRFVAALCHSAGAIQVEPVD